ncbi:MAG: molybdopterin-guanine dinucleotide biosynthesis protein B [Candidatus Hermodarchaeia archaeon]
MPLIINIVGIGRESGKTSLIEFLTTQLRKRQYSVATVKHISQVFDTIHKDTWRHIEAGASTVVAATPNELVSIKKIQAPSVEEALGEIPKDVDIILVEGFKKSKYPKVIVSQTMKDAETLMREIAGVFAISGFVTAKVQEKAIQGIPLLTQDELFIRVEEMLLHDIVNRLPGLNCGKCGYPLCDEFARALLGRENAIVQCIPMNEAQVILKVNDEPIYLSPFPATIIKNVVRGMISDLKGVDKHTIPKISLEIKQDRGR